MDATVSVTEISKRFGDLLAVDAVSFDVYPGEIFGLLGPNGAGKTTTIRMMLDIFHPDSGTVSVFGGPWSEKKKRRVGYLPEERGLYKDQPLGRVIAYLATLKGLTRDEALARMEPWLERLDLAEHRMKKVDRLSRGMQQKAQLIATLLHEPDLIVVDEPFSGLDPVNTRLVKEIILEQAAAGRTIIMSTHQMHQVEALCNRILLVHRGRRVLYGEVTDIKRGHAGNALLVRGSGDIGHIPGVLDARRSNGEWRLSLSPDVDPQEVLRELACRDNVWVERFEVAEPSLEDIFVAAVKGDVAQAPEAMNA
ncbi:MAG TPA: ATP-binding cassette domain-containing protein [Chloroflexi bacterium]|nr:ATP-binding cassette domain-containing protein [Chloroflexota bacterium]